MAKEMKTLAHVHVTGYDHNVHLSICLPTHTLHIFKYNEELGLCEYEVFNSQHEASIWVQQPLQSNPKPYITTHR